MQQKTTTAKKLAQEEGISVWQAERYLNADPFLDEYPWWEPHEITPPIPSLQDVLHMLQPPWEERIWFKPSARASDSPHLSETWEVEPTAVVDSLSALGQSEKR